MKKTEVQRVWWIKDYCIKMQATINRFGNNFDNFCFDNVYYNSTLFNLIQISEVSIKLANEYKCLYNNFIKWKELEEIAVKVKCDLHTEDRSLIWEIITIQVPILLKYCEKIIEDNKSDFVDNTIDLTKYN